MKLCLWVVSLLLLVSGTLSQDGFNLFDALDDQEPTPAKPKDQPKATEKPKAGDLTPTQKPKKPGSGDSGFDLSDVFDDLEPTPAKPKDQPKAPEKPKAGGELDLLDAFGPDLTPTQKPKKPSSGDSGAGGTGFDLNDALGPDTNPKPDKPVNPPKSGGGGGTFGDSDLSDVSGGDYKPDDTGGRRTVDPGYDPQGGADQPQGEGAGPIAGIVSAIGVALFGAASSYFAYQKKKLCFKMQGGADPESGKGHSGTQSEPQVFSNLLRTN
ncbi:CD99 molecule isoform X2 [Anabas testudineus]|uniref:CD99 molecule isoform X2 n=1 Tax=Anabas testudineus TaxID=64144 RepID=UPI000E465C31|nr:CD99 molecule isoform X2 [Anabas testudineus]